MLMQVFKNTNLLIMRSQFLQHNSNDQKRPILCEQDVGQWVDGSIALIPFLSIPYFSSIVKDQI